MISDRPTQSQSINLPAADVDLMQRIVERDQEALMALYQRFGNQVYSLALRVLRNPGLAEEATQDTFLKIWRKGESWNPERGQLSSWLLTITRYTAIDCLRREQRRSQEGTEFLDDLAEHSLTVSPVGDRRWLDGQLLRHLLGQIPAEQAEVIELAFFQGMTHSELADHLDWPLGTVKTRLRLGMQKLRELWIEATKL